MPAERDELVARIFHEVVECDGATKEAALDRHCAGDRALRAEVEALLRADDAGDGFLEPPVADQLKPTRIASVSSSPLEGTRIGRYQVRRLIATGGMGTVYEARQEQPRRTVALKVMRAELVSPEAQRRFEYESQILGALQHPGIAQVYEAGAEQIGGGGALVPFYAMELVAGARTIVEFAAEKDLGTPERMALFAEVCDAVQFAHNKGVIHRDLKPGNILIDASGRPKVIDFGVARVMSADIMGASIRTITGQLVGTLRYMSPEQCQGDPQAIDTRSDVYALGVLLYELLTGRLPYTFPADSAIQAPRIIHEVAPQRPSTILHSLRGDAETILLKALEKDRERRYQSAGALAADLRRFLHNEPVHARPPSAGYQLRMFARRNRALVGGAVLALLALVAGSAVATWQAVAATRQREHARAEAEVSRRTTEFLQDLLASADPSATRGREVTVREIVDRAAARIGESLQDQALVEAGVRATLGQTYIGLGDLPAAEEQFLGALRAREAAAGTDDPEFIQLQGKLANVHWMQGRLELVVPTLRSVLEGLRRTHDDDSEEVLGAMGSLATALHATGQSKEAIELNERALEGCRRRYGENHEITAGNINSLAFKYDGSGRSPEAEPLLRKALAIQRSLLGDDHPDTLTTLQNLSNNLRFLGRFDEAAPLARQLLEARRGVLPAGHPGIADACSILGRILTQQGDASGAEPLLRQGRDMLASALPAGSWRIATASGWLGVSLTNLGRFDQAEQELLGAHTVLQRTRGQHPIHEQGVIRAIVDLYRKWGKPDRVAEFEALLPVPAPK